MEIVKAAPEPALGDGLAPGLADEVRTEEAGGVVGRDAEQDLSYELVREGWRRSFFSQMILRQRSWCHGGR